MVCNRFLPVSLGNKTASPGDLNFRIRHASGLRTPDAISEREASQHHIAVR